MGIRVRVAGTKSAALAGVTDTYDAHSASAKSLLEGNLTLLQPGCHCTSNECDVSLQ